MNASTLASVIEALMQADPQGEQIILFGSHAHGDDSLLDTARRARGLMADSGHRRCHRRVLRAAGRGKSLKAVLSANALRFGEPMIWFRCLIYCKTEACQRHLGRRNLTNSVFRSTGDRLRFPHSAVEPCHENLQNRLHPR